MITPEIASSRADGWRVTLFGGLHLSQGTRHITHFRSQKAGTLLAYLLLHPDKAHRRDFLTELLFPDGDVENAQNTFRVTLSRLRALLTTPSSFTGGGLLETDRHTVRLVSETVVSDVAIFEAAVRIPAQIAELQKAADLYTGPLLIEYDDLWITPYRQRFEEQYLGALHRLVQAFAKQNDFEQALTYTLRAVATDPFQEERHADAMRFYMAMGRTAAAWTHFKEYERRLWEELNTEPSNALREIADRVCQHQSRPSPADFLSVTGASPVRNVQHALSEVPISAANSGIPTSPDRFFGRDEERETLLTLLLQTRQRLITITGPAGTGKTRLAYEVARQVAGEFMGGICGVALDAVSNIEQTIGKICEAVSRSFGVSSGDSRDSLLRALALYPPALLVLDNLEHLLPPMDGAMTPEPSGSLPDLIEALLRDCPHLTVLTTSRRGLHLRAEQEFVLMPLPVPLSGAAFKPGANREVADFAAIARSPSVQLFVDRMRRYRPDFTLRERNALSISRLCQQLEGIPLAIELAATWGRTLSPGQILTRLGGRPDLLCSDVRDVPERHRTLWAALDSSYRLLSPPLQRFFTRLAVFRGGWTIEAATAICAEESTMTDEVLHALRELQARSLVLDRSDGDASDSTDEETPRQGPRFRLLEAMRAFAWGQLTKEEHSLLLLRHTTYFADWAKHLNEKYTPVNRAVYFQAIARELDNLRCVLDRILEDGSSIGTEVGFRLARAIGDYWTVYGPLSEARHYMGRLLTLPNSALVPDRATVEMISGYYAFKQGDFAEAWRLEEACLATCQQVENRSALIGAYTTLCHLHLREKGIEAARPWAENAIAVARELGEPHRLLSPLTMLGQFEEVSGNYHKARTIYEELLVICRHIQSVQWIISTLVALAGLAVNNLHDYAAVENHLADAFTLLKVTPIPDLQALAHICYGNLFFNQERYGEAEREYRKAVHHFQAMELTARLVQSLWHLCHTHAKRHEFLTAARLLGAVDAHLDRCGDRSDGSALREEERDAAARAEIRGALSESAFRSAYNEGRALSPFEAADWILATDTQPG